MKSRALAICVLFCVLFAPSSAGAADHWLWPLEGHEVGKRFDLPNGPYGAGNRGVDLRSQVGAVVNSVAAGVVSYVGTINNIPIVVVDHGRERSTYQPVDASVQVGDSVTAGQSIGSLLGAGSHCPDSACLHLGRKIGDDYLDPLALLSTGGRVRLISPDGPPPTPPFGGDGSLRPPVGGPIMSPYGMRVHPITHERKLHDGTDFGVPCGTPVHAAAPGTVSSRSFSGAYGNRVILNHGAGLSTSYNHMRSQSVSVGDRVKVGDVVGHVGSTGMSTGCHLHFMVTKDGKRIDPMTML